ncbi:DEAD/DEAH box helicase [Armatimonas sp.]|uniref:DEAD/DEAH box helicase n=1 Tax=Armatimonas sp. TaxID=1872638 RepID=UPI00375216AF
MLILHASEEQGSLLIWGEQSEATAKAPLSPYDPGAKRLAEVLRPYTSASLVRSAWTAHAFLPTVNGRPLPSSPLLGEAPEGLPTLARWQVTALPLDEAEMVGVLAACQDKEALEPGVRLGASLAYWAAVFRFATALTLRQQLIPGIVEDKGEWFAQWQPVFAGEDARRFAALAKAMPGVCRALTQITQSSEPPQKPASAVLERVLTRLCDTLVRPTSSPKKPREFASLHHQWLHALQASDSQLKAETKALSEFAATIHSWQRPLFLSLAAPFRLCLRLEEPATDMPESTAWQVHYLLQSAADPSLFVPAEAAWSGKGALASLLRVPGFRPREFLLTALGEASRICPEVSQSLKAPTATGFMLSLAGVHVFLTERAALLEQTGFVVQLPGWWTGKSRPKLASRVTAKNPKMQGSKSGLTLESLVEFDYEVALEGEPLTLKELERLAKAKQPLVRLRGKWVQLDQEELQKALAFWKKQDGKALSLKDLIRLSLGVGEMPIGVESVSGDGELGALLARLTGEQALEPRPTPTGFTGVLRPYQERGYAWLRFLTDLGLGACLADDMGLGKSAQTIALLLDSPKPNLIVCPTSVVGNWQRELTRFAPSLSVLAHHGPERAHGKALEKALHESDILLTSYALLHRDGEELAKYTFTGVVLDEAQNIKNPETRQSKAARALNSQWRVALSGTPVENHVGDLWALFEFLNPGLLGSERTFKKEFYVPIQQERDEDAAAKLKKRTGPLILRRMKTDKSIISDLPDKIEQDEFCPLTAEQASLYEAVLRDLEERLEDAEGMGRRGLILSTLMKLKQLCNHPAQFLSDGSALANRSGKLERLTELCEALLASGEKALIFTQFAEMGMLLQKYLRETFGREVLLLHGGVQKKERDRLVERFQSEGRTPFFVLSLKAGGVGLNLTAASQVIHFDRWWNPAVEDQATDRAFRIGQVRNVLVHKFVCQGTMEERIAALIASKREVAGSVVGSGEQWLTELSTGELKSLFALSRERAIKEGEG